VKLGYARLDADFPMIYTADDTRPERLSDHDPPVVFLPLDPPATVPTAAPSSSPSPTQLIPGMVPVTPAATPALPSSAVKPAL